MTGQHWVNASTNWHLFAPPSIHAMVQRTLNFVLMSIIRTDVFSHITNLYYKFVFVFITGSSPPPKKKNLGNCNFDEGAKKSLVESCTTRLTRTTRFQSFWNLLNQFTYSSVSQMVSMFSRVATNGLCWSNRFLFSPLDSLRCLKGALSSIRFRGRTQHKSKQKEPSCLPIAHFPGKHFH